MIPHEYIEELTRRTDIVELVGNYVQLKRKGRLYGGLCPFHSEKSPSFYVYPDTQSFYCFGCGAGGDAITFAKKINSIDYPEAVKMLAAGPGCRSPRRTTRPADAQPHPVHEQGGGTLFPCLPQLHCGGGPAGPCLLAAARAGRQDHRPVRAGLCPQRRAGPVPVPARQRLQPAGAGCQRSVQAQPVRADLLPVLEACHDPLFDLRGNIIAFGGRVLDDSKPKYVNSPETLVYHKSDTVFALQIAKRSASRRFVLCEGYMDVISMQQAGIDTAVCACGTALTPDQVRLISEYADEVILSYDSDEAGQKATLRSLELFPTARSRWVCCRSPVPRTRTSTSKSMAPSASRHCWTAWAMHWTSSGTTAQSV